MNMFWIFLDAVVLVGSMLKSQINKFSCVVINGFSLVKDSMEFVAAHLDEKKTCQQNTFDCGGRLKKAAHSLR